MPSLDPRQIAEGFDAGKAAPVTRAAMVLEATLTEAPRAEVPALILADAALAHGRHSARRVFLGGTPPHMVAIVVAKWSAEAALDVEWPADVAALDHRGKALEGGQLAAVEPDGELHKRRAKLIA